MIDETLFTFVVGFIVGAIFMIGVGYVMVLRQIEQEDKG